MGQAQESELDAIKRQLHPLEAAVNCCPDTWTQRRIANVERPLYVQQLEWIEKDYDSILAAVNKFIVAQESRLNWYKERWVEEREVSQYEDSLKSQHQVIFERPDVEGEKPAVRGQETLRQCIDRGISMHVNNRQPYNEFCEGTLHKIANAAEIGWHPDWVNKVKGGVR